ncbi:cms1 ribosomal small subunit [Mortierella claussenii]|nr:cms1 ribosomal small subunit [Mortierella claussenii]
MAKIKESGDALEDDFQLSDTEYLSDGEDAGERIDDLGAEDNTVTAGSKRKADAAPKKKKQNKSKKARIEENNTPLGKRTRASQIEALNDSQDRALEHLSSIEREERRIPESSIKDVSPFALDHTLVHLESFLKFAVANWKSKLLVKDANAVAAEDKYNGKHGKKGAKHGGNSQKDQQSAGNKRDPKKKPLETSSDLPKGSPVVLMVSASGIRAVEVIRSLPLFAEAAKVGKLFAKHLKVSEQVYFLENTCTHICVGTPNRIDKLIADGALHLDRLELVLLDCHRDAKKRTLLDIQEIRVDLFKMLGLEALDEKIRSGQTQVALF